MIDTDFD